MNLLDHLIITTAGKKGENIQNPDYTYLHLCYQAGEYGQLESRYIVRNSENSYMGIIENKNLQKIQNPQNFTEDIIYEVHRLHYLGVFADIEDPDQQKELLPILDEKLFMEQIPLFVPLSAEKWVKHGEITLSTDISGGSLEEYVSHYVDQYGAERIAAQVAPVFADFKLPTAKSGNSVVTPDRIDALIQQYHASIFYSKELQCNYFTYMDEEDCGHFVVFDNRRTIEKKIYFLFNLGIQHFFMIYPDYTMIFVSQ